MGFVSARHRPRSGFAAGVSSAVPSGAWLGSQISARTQVGASARVPKRSVSVTAPSGNCTAGRRSPLSTHTRCQLGRARSSESRASRSSAARTATTSPMRCPASSVNESFERKRTGSAG